jgi:hypothetical protein
MDEKCAPSKTYKDGSCFTLKSLKKIAESYNIKNPMNKIQITENKEELVKELESRMKNTCNDQTCWLRTDFVKAMNDEEIEVEAPKKSSSKGKKSNKSKKFPREHIDALRKSIWKQTTNWEIL